MTTHRALSRDLSLFDVTLIGVGAMIGAGIFVLTGDAAGIAGPSVILAFALNGLVTMTTAVVYAELGSAIPEAGGGYLWIKEGLPGANSFLAGWMSWFAHAVAGALYALGFGAFLYELLRISGVDWAAVGIGADGGKKIFGLAVAAAFAFINYRGSSETGTAGTIITLAKLVVILLFCFFGIKHMFFPEALFRVGSGGGQGLAQLQPLIPKETGWLGVLSAMGLTFIAFEGYEIIVQAGEEVRRPREMLPKAIFISLAIVVPIYMLVGFVLVGGAESELLYRSIVAGGGELPSGIAPNSPSWTILGHLGELGLARVADELVPLGGALILTGGILATMSALNATTFSSTRVAFAMARDRNLPDRMASINERTRTPHVALLATAIIIGVMVAFVPLTTVAAAADIMFLLLFLQVNAAAITIRRKYGDKLAFGFLNPLYPVIPIVSIAANLVLAATMFYFYASAWLYVGAWIGAGVLIHQTYARHRGAEAEAPAVVFEKEPFPVTSRSVVVAVPDQPAEDLVTLGRELAAVTDADLLLLYNVVVPRQLPRRFAGSFIDQGQEVLDRAREIAAGGTAPVGSLIRVGARPARSIYHTVADHHAAFVVMGWSGRFHRFGAELGYNIDRVIRNSRCHAIVVEHTGEARRRVDRVLVALGPKSMIAPSLCLASALVSVSGGAHLTFLRAVDHEPNEEDEREIRRWIEEAVEEAGRDQQLDMWSIPGFAVELVQGDVLKTVASRSADFDRVVIGLSSMGLLRRQVLRPLSHRIAAAARCPVVLIRPAESAVRFEVQQFFQFFRELEEQGEPERTEEEQQGEQQGEPQ